MPELRQRILIRLFSVQSHCAKSWFASWFIPGAQRRNPKCKYPAGTPRQRYFWECLVEKQFSLKNTLACKMRCVRERIPSFKRFYKCRNSDNAFWWYSSQWVQSHCAKSWFASWFIPGAQRRNPKCKYPAGTPRQRYFWECLVEKQFSLKNTLACKMRCVRERIPSFKRFYKCRNSDNAFWWYSSQWVQSHCAKSWFASWFIPGAQRRNPKCKYPTEWKMMKNDLKK